MSAKPAFTAADSLHGEMIDLVEVSRTGRLNEWEAYSSKPERIRVLLYDEDRRAIQEAGYDVSTWGMPEVNVPDPIFVILSDQSGYRRVAEVVIKDGGGKTVKLKSERRS